MTSVVKTVTMNTDDNEVFERASPPRCRLDSLDGNARIRPYSRKDSSDSLDGLNSRTRPTSRTWSTASNGSTVADDLDDPDLPELLTVAGGLDREALEAVLVKIGTSGVGVTSKNDRTAAHVILMRYSGLDFSEQIEVRSKLIAMLKILAEAGLDMNCRDRLGQTALHMAASMAKQPDVLRALVANGAQINDVDRSHQTALHRAGVIGDLTNVQTLVQLGADVNSANANGQTTLHIISKGKRNLLIVQFLLRRGAEVDPRDCAMRTPLHVAAKAGRPEVVCELLTFGANSSAVQSAGQSALHLAAANDMTGETLRVLLDTGVDVNTCDSVVMETPLHSAVCRGMLENVAALTSCARADARDVFGETALHKAATCHNVAMWLHLLRMPGVDVNARNNNGLTVMSKALKTKNAVAMAMLQSHVTAE